MSISELSDWTLVKIFEFLNASQRIRIEKVCKRWSGLSKRTWTKFHTLNDSSFIRGSLKAGDGPTLGKVLKKACTLKTLLSRCGNYLKTLTLNVPWPDACKYDVLSTVARFCPNLETVEFFAFSLEERSLRRLAIRCRKLKSVAFVLCFRGNFDNLDVVQFFLNCPNLTSLNLNNNELTGYNFDCCLPCQLEYLSLSGCYRLQSSSFQHVADRCLNLRYLNLSCCGISTECLEYIFQRLTKLQLVCLEDCGGEDELSNALSNLSELQQLFLRNNQCINDDTVATVSRSCPNLIILDVSSCQITDVGVHYLRRLQHLIELNLSCCDVTDVGVKMLANMRNLERLRLNSCYEITDEAISDLAVSCYNLRELNLSFCTNITIATVGVFYSIASDKTVFLSLILTGTDVLMEEIQMADHPMLKLVF